MTSSTALATRVSQITATSPRRRSPALSVTKLPRQARDAPYLAELLELHAGIDASDPKAGRDIIDATWCTGAIWGRLPIGKSVIKCDIDPDLPNLDVVSSWEDLPQHLPPSWARVFVVDPIHVGDVGPTSKRYNRYVAEANPVKGASIAPLFPGIFAAAEWLLKPCVGVMLIKLIDLVRSGRFQWESHRLVEYAESRGWTACQYVAMPRPPGRDPKHHNRYHANVGSTLWIVLRYGPACHGPGRRLKYELTCEVCGERFWSRRSDARTCPGGKCRKRRSRAVRENFPEPRPLQP